MEKESVKKFDLEAAFKALDEIDIPQVKGIKANRVNLKERFAQKSATETLVEDYYDVSNNEDLEEAQEEREGEVAQAKLARIEKIVDLDAESPDDLLPSYVGKVIMQCPQCMTLFYKNPEDIEHSEENPDVVNINEVCQHCGNTSGYTLIGKVGAVSDEEASEYQAEEAPAEENELDLDFDTEEAPAEEEQPAEEGEKELDLDLNLEEEPEEEGTNESLNLSKEVSENETEHKSENLTLNEDVGDDELLEPGEAPEAQKVPEVSAFIDCSGSWRKETIEACGKRAINENPNCKVNIFYFSDHVYTDMDQACRGGATAAGPEIIEYAHDNPDIQVVVYTDEDMLYQGGKALFDGSIPNVKLIRVDLGESLNEEVDKVVGIIDLSGSQGESCREPYSKIAKENGATEIIATEDPMFKEVEDSCKDGKCILVTCDDDIKYNRPELLDNPNLKVIKVDRPTNEGLTEDVDKDLDKKLKAHNDYIAYLQQMIKQEEEALKKADNDEIKAAIQRRLDAFNADLEVALPDAVKEEAPVEETAAPAEEPTEEVETEEALTEEIPAEEPKEEPNANDAEAVASASEEVTFEEPKDCKVVLADDENRVVYSGTKENCDKIVEKNKDREKVKAHGGLKVICPEANESLNKSEAAPSENETENGSENLTLNEDVNPFKPEEPNPFEPKEPKKKLPGEMPERKYDNPKDPFICSNESLTEEGNAKWNALSNRPKGQLSDLKKDPDWEGTDKYIIYGTDVKGKVLDKKEMSGKPADAKAARDDLLKSNKEITDTYVAQFWKNKKTEEEKEVELDGYMKSRQGYRYATEGLEEDAEPNDAAKALDGYLKDEEPKEECLKEADSQEDTEAKLANFEADLQTENLKEASDIDSILDDYIKSLPEDLEECSNKLQEAPKFDDISDAEFKQMLNSETFNESVKIEESELPSRAVINAIADRIRHAGEDYVEEDLTEDAKEETPVEDEPVEGEPEEEASVDEAQPIETTVEEVKEIATEVANKVAEPAADEEAAEAQQEEIQEIVDETVEEKLDEEKPAEDEAEEAAIEEPEFSEDDVDDLDECSLNKHIDEYLQEVYSNVKCFEATECKLHEGKLFVEGKISFNSGKEKLTMFEFLPAYCEGKLFFEGYNKDFSEDKAFTLNCLINESKTLITESFGYKYKINENLVEGLK